MNTRTIGSHAETLALKFLVEHGLQLREQNYQTRIVEIDLIMRDGDALVFIEVRMRASARHGGAPASVDRRKQRKISLTALASLQKNRLSNHYCRFDVLSVNDTSGSPDSIDWIRNAFDYTG